MKIDKNNLANISNNDIYELYQDSFDELYNVYRFMNLDKGFYYKMVLDEINRSKKEYNGITSYDQYIKNRVNALLNREIKKSINDSKTQLNFLNNYINYRFNNISDYREAYEGFSTLNRFVKDHGFIINPDLMTLLIKTNSILKSMVNKVFTRYNKSIVSGITEQVFNNETLILAIEIFCDLENVEINDETLNDLVDDESSLPDDLSCYLSSISGISLLTREEEQALGIEIANNNKEARNKLVEHNLKLVVKIAKLYKHVGELNSFSLMDLIQEGNIGLIKAVDKYDYKKGTKFSTYAIWWIKQTITRALSEKARVIRISVGVSEKLQKLRKEYRILEQKLGRMPTVKEISKVTGYSLKEAEKLTALLDDTLSLDEPVNNSDTDEPSELIDFIADTELNVEDGYTKKEIVIEIHKLIDSLDLTENEKYVLYARFGFINNKVMTLNEIGNNLGLTRERIRQIESKVLKKIHHYPKIKELAVYLDKPDEGLRKIEELKKIEKTKPKQTYKSINKDIEYINNNPRNVAVNTIYDYFANYSDLKIDNKELIDFILNQDVVANTYSGQFALPQACKGCNTKITVSDCDVLMDLLKDENITSQFSGLKTFELMALLLNYGYVNQKGFSVASISSFLGLKYQYTTNFLRSAYIRYQNILSNIKNKSRKLIKDEDNN